MVLKNRRGDCDCLRQAAFVLDRLDGLDTGAIAMMLGKSLFSLLSLFFCLHLRSVEKHKQTVPSR